jgi:hypothetical protein
LQSARLSTAPSSASGYAAVVQYPQIFSEIAMPDPTCKHTRTRLIAKDDDSQYVECLDCGEILEAGEFDDTSDSGGSLSDA